MGTKSCPRTYLLILLGRGIQGQFRYRGGRLSTKPPGLQGWLPAGRGLEIQEGRRASGNGKRSDKVYYVNKQMASNPAGSRTFLAFPGDVLRSCSSGVEAVARAVEAPPPRGRTASTASVPEDVGGIQSPAGASRWRSGRLELGRSPAGFSGPGRANPGLGSASFCRFPCAGWHPKLARVSPGHPGRRSRRAACGESPGAHG